MKKFISIMIALLMVTALTFPVAAAPNNVNHTITITNTDSSVKHTYEAYRVFEGNLDTTEEILTNINWSNGVDGAALLADLTANLTDFASCTSSSDVANVLVDYIDDNNSTAIDTFAAVVGNHLATVAGTSTENASPYTIAVQGDGYYFIKDKNDSVTAEGEAYSKYMLNVVRDVTIEAKDEHLVPEKKIVENGNEVSTNVASIGDEITFKITIDVPKMDGYKAYTFTMNDTLSKGLKFEEIKSVTVASENLVENGTNGYTLTTTENADGTTSLTIDFKNFIRYKRYSATDSKVVVTYTATLDTDAFVGVEGNPNTVDFTYSNNPSSTGEGDGGDTGITPESETITYTTGLNLIKVDGSDRSKLLQGAKFKIEGDGLNTVITTGTKFEKAPYTAGENETVDADTYYLLADGTYSKTQPASYTGDTYVLVHFTKYTTKSTGVVYDGTTGPDGRTNFIGLTAGTYTLTELEEPDGYNLLTEPIEFEITWDETNGFAVAVGDQSGVTYDGTTGTFRITVENNKGSVLPHTGGIGTTIFMFIGAFLVLGAAVILVSVIVTRKRERF
ncbi:MAG: SpaH/EbpB family LPXTG-anchored major pilin [Ruminococcus sp.]|nr:SpaH/EbpB family LPXTG-anchored major pilin [Ruminococcus sp.]